MADDATLMKIIREVLLKDPYIVANYGNLLCPSSEPGTIVQPPYPEPKKRGTTPEFDAGISSAPPAKPPLPPSSSNATASPDADMPTLSDISEMSESDDSTPPPQNLSSDSASDEFQLVSGNRKKRARKAKSSAQAAPAKAPKTEEASSSAPPSTPVPTTTSSQASPAPTPTPANTQPQSQPAKVPKKDRKPPAIFIQAKDKWNDVSKMCTELGINYLSARTTAVGVKVAVPTAQDFKSLTRALQDRNVYFHTYSLAEERPLRVVLKGIPKEIDTDSIKDDLLSQNIPVLEVHRMHAGRNGEAYDMVLAICEKSTDNDRKIFNIKTVCHLSGIKIEPPHRYGPPGQCHRCQLYGHAQRHCYAKPRCVKCLGDHSTSDCDRPKDRTLCTEPPSCVLCGESGHPANYRGCPKAPRANNKVAKRKAATQAFAAAHYASQAPPMSQRLSPQRPSPWNALNHQQAFPALRPSLLTQQATQASAIPSLMTAPQTAPYLPVPYNQPAPQVHAQRAAPPSPQSTPHLKTDDLSVCLGLLNSVDPNRVAQMAAAIRANQGQYGLMLVLSDFADVSSALLSYRVHP